MGKTIESEQIAEDVKKSEPSDDPTLQAMTLYYRETNQPEHVCGIYEAAVKMYPKNDELLSHLFMSYVRVHNYRKQQQTALALHKVVPNNPYYFWGVMSIFMQGYTNPVMEKTMYLPLAEKMVEKFMEEKKIDAEAEVKMYVMILDRLGKYEKITDLLESPLGSRISGPEEHGRLLIDSLIKSEKLECATEKLVDLLQKNPDQWSFVVDYLAVVVQLSTGNPHHLQTAHAFICSLAREQDKVENTCVRAPYLGRLELLRQLKETKRELEWKQVLNLGSPVDDFLTYFQKFGSKLCFFEDVRTFIPFLSEDEKKVLLERMSLVVNDLSIDYDCSEQDKKANILKMQQHLALLQVKHLCGAHLGLKPEDKMAAAELIHEAYKKGLKLGNGDHSTEWHPADLYIVLYAHLMFEVYQETRDHGLLLELVLTLERAHKRSLANAQILLLLLKLFIKLGVFEQCTKVYDKLDIKQIQVDTVGYFLHRCMMTSGIFSLCEAFFGFALKFFWNAKKEVGEYIIQAYKNGSFHVVIEMADLQKQLEYSYSFHLLLLRKQLVVLTESVHTLESLKQSLHQIFSPEIKVTTGELVDNRDMRVLESYGPPQLELTGDDVKNSFQLECVYFEFLTTVMQGIKMAALVSDREWNIQSFQEVLSRLEGVIKEARHLPFILASGNADIKLIPIRAPPLCEITVLLKWNFDKVLLTLLKIVLKIKEHANDEVEGQVKECLEMVIEVLKDVHVEGLSAEDYDTLQSILADSNGDVPPSGNPLDVLKRRPVDVETLGVFTQVVSMVTLLSECAVEAISGCQGNTQLSKKKRKKKTSEQGSVQMCRRHLQWFTEELAGIVERRREEIKLIPQVLDVTSLMKKMHLEPQEDETSAVDVYRLLVESYNSSYSECTEALKHKSCQLGAISERLKN
jgi:N-terminal acetyltransferase B complex non-catalytic subunit